MPERPMALGKLEVLLEKPETPIEEVKAAFTELLQARGLTLEVCSELFEAAVNTGNFLRANGADSYEYHSAYRISGALLDIKSLIERPQQ